MNEVFLQRLDEKSVLSDYLLVIEELERQRDVLISQQRQMNETLQSSNRIIGAMLKSQGGSVTITNETLISLKGIFEIVTRRDPVTTSLQIVLVEHDQS